MASANMLHDINRVLIALAQGDISAELPQSPKDDPSLATTVDLLDQLLSQQLVLMDLQLPRLGGLAATRAIRDGSANALDPNIPIVAMMQRRAHRLKGAAANIGAFELAAAARELEASASSGEQVQIQRQFEQLEDRYQRAIRAVRDRLAPLEDAEDVV